MKKIKKIKIRINGKVTKIDESSKMQNLVNKFKIPIKKVAIELNNEIINKKRLDKIKLKDKDKIEIVHFIGGG